MISRTITGGLISQEEFKMILDEIKKYKVPKDQILDLVRSKQTEVSEEERKKLIEKGKARALSANQTKIIYT